MWIYEIKSIKGYVYNYRLIEHHEMKFGFDIFKLIVC